VAKALTWRTGPTDQYDMPAQAQRAAREQQARLDARWQQYRQDKANESFQRQMAANTSYRASSSASAPPIYDLPITDAVTSSTKDPVQKVLTWTIGTAVLLTILAFYAFPPITSHIRDFTPLGHAVATGVAAIIVAFITLAVVGIALGIINYVRSHPLQIAVICGLAAYGWYHFSH
jgi:hypothetical protein